MATKKIIYRGIEVTFTTKEHSFHYSFEYKKKRYGNGCNNCLSPLSEANMIAMAKNTVETVIAKT